MVFLPQGRQGFWSNSEEQKKRANRAIGRIRFCGRKAFCVADDRIWFWSSFGKGLPKGFFIFSEESSLEERRSCVEKRGIPLPGNGTPEGGSVFCMNMRDQPVMISLTHFFASVYGKHSLKRYSAISRRWRMLRRGWRVRRIPEKQR